MGTSARYLSSQEHDHECKPSPHGYTSASTSDEEAEQAARADCCGTGDWPGCARSQVAANVFTIPHDDEREAAFGAGLACWRALWDSSWAKQSMCRVCEGEASGFSRIPRRPSIYHLGGCTRTSSDSSVFDEWHLHAAMPTNSTFSASPPFAHRRTGTILRSRGARCELRMTSHPSRSVQAKARGSLVTRA